MEQRIRRQLAGSKPQDSQIVQRPGWGDIPDDFRHLFPDPLIPAAVLFPLIRRDGEISVLLTKRAAHLKHHGGQISFPGGRMETVDSGPLATALRETEEEIGIPADQVDVVGYLDNYFTITGFSVTPVVGFFDGDLALKLDRAEVEDTFEVPLGHLLDPGEHRKKHKEFMGQKIAYYEIEWEERIIWGATAAMIVCFHDRIMGSQK
ncbi:MAG: CoA pyrophosphatase [Gammaproteobacteria bacterium]|nr:CoA pyrophosphatase [Gammaproteobacteria bacterium]NNF66538.1 CoA pyrophosphatase [Gammaproteobacteria bacterium]